MDPIIITTYFILKQQIWNVWFWKKYHSFALISESHTVNFYDDYAASEVGARATSFISVNDDVFKGTKPWVYYVSRKSARDMSAVDPGSRAL